LASAASLSRHPADDTELLAVISVFRAPPRKNAGRGRINTRLGRAVKKKVSRRGERVARGVARKWSEVFLFSPRKRLRGSGVTGGLKSIKRNPDVGRFKKIIRTGETTRCGRAEWKSRLSHYLLTIHYWIRYSRLRIPIAESSPRRSRAVRARIVSTNKPANTHGRAATCTRPPGRLFVRALARVLEINPTPEGRASPASVFV